MPKSTKALISYSSTRVLEYTCTHSSTHCNTYCNAHVCIIQYYSTNTCTMELSTRVLEYVLRVYSGTNKRLTIVHNSTTGRTETYEAWSAIQTRRASRPRAPASNDAIRRVLPPKFLNQRARVHAYSSTVRAYVYVCVQPRVFEYVHVY